MHAEETLHEKTEYLCEFLFSYNREGLNITSRTSLLLQIDLKCYYKYIQSQKSSNLSMC